MKVVFSENAIKEYFEWQNQDKKTLKKINELIKDIQRNGMSAGIGKPEPLKHIKAFSRKIDDANRLVYVGNENKDLEIISCKGHYEN